MDAFKAFGRHGLAVLAAATGLLAAADAAGQVPRLLAPLGEPAREVPAEGFRSAATPVTLNAAKMLSRRVGQEMELALPNGTSHGYVMDFQQSHGDGMHSWVGHHKFAGTAYRAIFTLGPAGSFGVVDTPQGQFRVVPGPGHDWLLDMKAEEPFLPEVELLDDVRIPPATAKRESAGVPSMFTAVPGVNVPATYLAAPAPAVTVDIMFVATRGLAQRLGPNLLTRLNFLVTRANTAYADSEVAISLRLVHAMVVDYTDGNDNGVALNQATPGCVPSCSGTAYDAATFAVVEAQRVAVGADVVAVLRNGGSFGGGGIAWLGGPAPTASFMYSVTTGCVLGCESVFIHEVGHNMGNQHDRATHAWQQGGTPAAALPGINYGYAFCAAGNLSTQLSCNPDLAPGAGGCAAGNQPECATPGSGSNNFSDIMAYFHGTTLRNYKFANPNVTCAGATPTALPCGNAASNAALSMNNNRVAMSAIKTQVIPDPLPGAIQFAVTAASALESAGTITFGVTRIGGTGGTVGVSYTTSSGSAIAGQDFTATSGTLSWGPGDAATKNIVVPITNDGATEDAETFTVTLSAPTGPAGVFLGYPVTATGVILGPWPRDGVLPAGFSGAWALATDKAYEGTHSLRSPQVYGVPPSTYTNTDTTFTGTFTNGVVGFAYLVSGLANFSFFEFSIDGVVVVSDTGETAWKYVTVPITAGAHTLRWRYRNALDSPCNFYVGTSDECADRAWIDALSLPLPAPTVARLTDLNGDGRSDLLYRNNTNGQVYRFFANGLALSGAALVYNEPNTAWTIVADTDFNGDGVSDLVYRNATTGGVFVVPFGTSGVAIGGNLVYSEPNATWKIVGTPDFDGDNRSDLLWWNSGTGQVYAMLSTGTGIGAQGFVYSEPNTAWRIVATGDFAGSGKRNQLLWRNSSTGQVYLMTVTVAGGVFSQTGQMVYTEANTAWKIIAAADFNGDGKSDILYRNDTDGRVFMLLMNGGAVLGGGIVYTEGNLAWKIVSTGDYNGDGRADFLYRNDSTGQVYMILMNGTAVVNQGMVYHEPNTAWRVLGPAEYAQ